MPNADKLGLLRKLLKALRLNQEAVDEIVDRIVELLSGESKQEPVQTYPYHLRDDFLTPAEHSFYLVLRKAVDDWAVVCPKVSLNDIFNAQSSDYGEYRTYTNKIDRKHIDFLLCEPGTVRPIAGIELDDKSHRRRDRQERDEFVGQVFKAAGLPLLRVRVHRAYDVKAVRAGLRKRLRVPASLATEEQDETVESAVAEAPVPEDEVPTCPRCGSPMVLRTAKRGANAGNQFWGCTTYPHCRAILPYET